MMSEETTREMLVDECDVLTASLYGLTYEEYTAQRDSLPSIPQNRAKIRLGMYDRILQDGWLHE